MGVVRSDPTRAGCPALEDVDPHLEHVPPFPPALLGGIQGGPGLSDVVHGRRSASVPRRWAHARRYQTPPRRRHGGVEDAAVG
jgi:hypothetical protein